MIRTLLFCSLFFVSVARAEDYKLPPRHVSVTGTAIARVQPDTVVWQATIRRTNPELAKAQAECDEAVQRILAMRAKLKIEPQDVQTGYLSVQKVYDRDQAGNRGSFRYFEVVRSVTLRQKDTTLFDQVLAQLVEISDVEVGHHLESSEYHKVRAETRLEAVKAARQKAAAMAELLGAKLGRVVRIAEPQDGGDPYRFNVNSNSHFAAPRQAEPDKAPGTFAPGAIEVRVSIDVVFEMD